MKTIINGETQMSQDCEQRNHEHTDKESVTDYEAFERGLTALMDGDKDVDDDRLCERLVDYLAAQPWGACIDRDYASEDFKRTLGSCGRDAIVERVLDWAEELANAIRWPVAYTYIVTGKLPGEYRENTNCAGGRRRPGRQGRGAPGGALGRLHAHRERRGALPRLQLGDRPVRDRSRGPLHLRLPLRRAAQQDCRSGPRPGTRPDDLSRARIQVTSATRY